MEDKKASSFNCATIVPNLRNTVQYHNLRPQRTQVRVNASVNIANFTDKGKCPQWV